MFWFLLSLSVTRRRSAAVFLLLPIKKELGALCTTEVKNDLLLSDLSAGEIGNCSNCWIFRGLLPAENADATSSGKRLPVELPLQFLK